MLVWLLLLLSIIVIWFMLPDALGEKKKKLIFLGLSFAILVFILGSRSNGGSEGSDLYSYYRWYRRAMNLPLDQLLLYKGVEEGYLILNKILSVIVPWNQFIFYFQSAFCTSIMFWYIYRNVDDVFLGVMVYICIGPWQFFLTGFRQSIACCICFIAFELIKKRRTSCDVAALLLIALASTIHTTAWLFLTVFVIRYFKVGRNVVIFSLFFTMLGVVFSDELMALGNETLGRDYTAGLYSGNVFGGIVPITVYLITLILCYIAWYNDKAFSQDYSMEIKLMIFGLCLYTLRYNTTVFERMSHYFTPVISVLLPSAIMRQTKENERKVVSAICVGLCVGLYIYRTTAQFGDYHFYWE